MKDYLKQFTGQGTTLFGILLFTICLAAYIIGKLSMGELDTGFTHLIDAGSTLAGSLIGAGILNRGHQNGQEKGDKPTPPTPPMVM